MKKEHNLVLGSIGVQPISNTQELRVDLVEGATEGEVRVSIQKWWRKDTDSTWNKGKGLYLTKQEAEVIKDLLGQAVM